MSGRSSLPTCPMGTMCSADYPRDSVFNRLDTQKEDCDMPARLKWASTLTGIALIVVMILAVACSSTETPQPPEQPDGGCGCSRCSRSTGPTAAVCPAAAPSPGSSSRGGGPTGHDLCSACGTRSANKNCQTSTNTGSGRTDQARRNSEDRDCPACSVPRSPQGWTCEQSQRVCRHVQLVD